ncbi:DNA mismatch repair protein MutS, partial [Psychroflexus salinarum]
MIKDIIYQIKYTFTQIKFNRKKELNNRLKESFGKPKDDSFDFDYIEKYFRNKDNSKAYQILSDKTCNDLDFDDLFMFLDRTHSKVGQQYLYNILRTIDIDEKQTKLNEEIINKLSESPELRISVQKKLEKLKNTDSYHISELFQEEHLEPPNW